jgi:hypothetical protein
VKGLASDQKNKMAYIFIFFSEMDAPITALLEVRTHSKIEWAVTTVILKPPFLTILYVERTFRRI